MHCGACVGTCQQNAIFLHETRIEFNEDCNECGVCIRVCPVGAIDENPED
jgi:NAD-dependent dihydropyrimidine dehydrogenase PreA subunit